MVDINDELNLVIPFGDGLIAYHTPISRDIYEQHYAVLNAAMAAMARKGVNYLRASGPSIAHLVLKDEGRRDAAERVEKDSTPALLSEIKRLTNILTPGPSGYELLPVDTAIGMGKLDDEEWGEVVAAAVFFTCLVQTAKKSDRKMVAASAALASSGSITSSGPMEYGASLRKSTKAESTPATASSLPV